MKKIMFNDKFGLTEAVLEGRKTMTRRIVPEKLVDSYCDYNDYVCAVAPSGIPYTREYEKEFFLHRSPFKVGEVVAVAQNYKDAGFSPDTLIREYKTMKDVPGWTNKMFVEAQSMRYFIRITNVRVERMQDISDEDCLREGIRKMTFDTFSFDSWKFFARSPREAFAALIDRLSGKGTFESNPWVFVYEFELIK